ncbi:flippase-like domain-containing protein [bacterium]|nr:flippase-like domain-containing protein [bacterium]
MDRETIPADETSLPLKKTAADKTKQLLGYLFAAVCLIWVFHDIDYKALWQNMASISWGWVALAIFIDLLSYVCQGLRWKYLLRPVKNISVVRTTQAVYIGLFINEIIPMRLGELVRVYMVARWASVNFFSVVPSIVVERLFDSIWVAIVTGLIAMLVPLPHDIIEIGDILGLIVLGATGLFIYIVFCKKTGSFDIIPPVDLKPKFFGRILSLLRRLTDGIRGIGTSRSFYLAFFVSFFYLSLQLAAFWFIMLAYGLELSFLIGSAVFLIVYIGTALPNTPSNVGSYQFFCVLGLTFFGVDKTTAAGFSLIVFLLLTIPLWIFGFGALSFSGMSLTAVRDEIYKLKTKEKQV